MHSQKIATPNSFYIIHHDGDYKGDVTLVKLNSDGETEWEQEFPAQVFKEFVAEMVRSNLTGKVEQMDTDELLTKL